MVSDDSRSIESLVDLILRGERRAINQLACRGVEALSAIPLLTRVLRDQSEIDDEDLAYEEENNPFDEDNPSTRTLAAEALGRLGEALELLHAAYRAFQNREVVGEEVNVDDFAQGTPGIRPRLGRVKINELAMCIYAINDARRSIKRALRRAAKDEVNDYLREVAERSLFDIETA